MAAARVLDAAVVEVTVEPGLIDRGERRQTHRDRRELPEVGHKPGVRVRREPLAGDDLAAEVVELALSQPTFQECAGVDAGRGVALVEHLVAHPLRVLAAEEMIEADFVEAGRRGIRREVAADPSRSVVRPQDHGCRIPTHHAADSQLHRLIARKVGFLLGRDRVDVAGLRQRRQADIRLACPLEQLVEDELRAVGATLLGDRVERFDPILGLAWVRIRWQELEVAVLVEHVRRIVGLSRCRMRRAVAPSSRTRAILRRWRCRRRASGSGSTSAAPA